MTSRTTSLGAACAAAALAVSLVLAPGAGARPAAECGLPAAAPLWIDYGEASVRQDVRAVLAKPGVVVATSGTGAIPAAFRAAGAATTYFELHLDRIAGEPADPDDPATVVPAADALYDRAVRTTGCATPWIALNELQGSQLATPWSATNTTYRTDVMTLLQRLAERGAHPALLIHGNPTIAGDVAAWWRTASQYATLVYEAYYDASKMYTLGPLMASRRMRQGMRFTVDLFKLAGVPEAKIGFMLGFHSAQTPGIGGRQGLEPTEAWLRVVKWEALAARQVAADTGVPTLWSWGWGTFGPESVDEDKAAAACTWLWARDQTLCDAPALAGPNFVGSLIEGQIVVPTGVACSFGGGRVTTSSVNRLARLTHDPQLALTAQFGRAALLTAAPVNRTAVLAAEKAVVARAFKGKVKAYQRALRARGADAEIARGIIDDALRRQAIARKAAAEGMSAFDWIAARESAAVDTAICLRDVLPGVGEPLARGNRRDVGTVPLASYAPFLLRDRTPPAAPAAPVATRTGQTVTLTWQSGREPDLAAYEVLRSVGGAPAEKISASYGLIGRAEFVDAQAPAGATYSIQAVDTSGNRSAVSPRSPEATPPFGRASAALLPTLPASAGA